jgi:hypothetical protein
MASGAAVGAVSGAAKAVLPAAQGTGTKGKGTKKKSKR